MPKFFKLVTFVPVTHAADMRMLLGKLGCGKVGNYDFASFSARGVGRFRPLQEAKPAIGEIGKVEEVEEERIETVVEEANLEGVLRELRLCHPYEEAVIDLYELKTFG